LTSLDGSLKTIEKAKEYNATVVNSRWLEEYNCKPNYLYQTVSCIEGFHCAPFEKYKPILPDEADCPFLASQQFVRKQSKNMN